LPRAACHARADVAADDDGAGLRQGLPARHPAPGAVLQHVLAHARHHLGGDLHRGLPVWRGSGPMTHTADENHPSSVAAAADRAPGDPRAGRDEILRGVRTYLIGLALAALITVVAFFIARTTLVWQPSIPVALFVLAIAQMGVHLAFFLHI